MSNDLVALIRHKRSLEKVALPLDNLYNTASTALANRGINPLGTIVGGTVGAVSGAVKGYKNAEEGNKLKGAIAGGLAGGAGGALLGHTVHQSAKNLKGTMAEMSSAKKGLADAYGSKHEMGFLDRLKSRFSKEGRQNLEQANQRFASDKQAKKLLRDQHAQTLSDEKLKIQMNPTLSYDDQVKKIDELYKSNPQGRYEIVNDKRKGALFGPVAAGLTAGAISTAGQTAFAAPDPNMVVESLKAKKNLTEQDKFIINEKMKQIQGAQMSQAPQGNTSSAM
jgi:hypothetical protein